MSISKTAGLLIVALVGVLIGLDAIRRNTASLRQSESLQHLVDILSLRIREYHSPLCEIYENFRDPCLENCGFLDRLRRSDMESALQTCEGLCIPRAVRDCMTSLASQLGKTGTDEQISHCACCSAELQRIISEMRQRFSQKNRMLFALGTSGGLLLDLLLL